jgi:hypothetical protein
MTSDAFVPPNPKEFDSTVRISFRLARCGTRSMALSTEGLSRLMRRRRDLVADRQHREDRLDRARRTEQMARSHDLVDDIRSPSAALPNTRCTAPTRWSSAIVEVPCALT